MNQLFKNKLIFAFGVLFALASCSSDKTEVNRNETASQQTSNESAAPAAINYGVVQAYPHDTTAFTEGLLFHAGKLYESTGSPTDMAQTKSVIGEVDLNTGKLQVKVELNRNKYFGEGMVILNNKVYQLTYLSKVGFVYDFPTFKKLGEFTFPSTEGWGLTTDGTYLIMSDGTSQLTYLHPDTFKTEKILGVADNQGAVEKLNELEYIKGFIYANIYTTNTIVKIDPESGKVVGKLDLSSLAQDARAKNPAALELNGIAYHAATDQVYVTGKMWPNIYALQFDF